MSIAIGLDFGSLGCRAAYVREAEIISVPILPSDAISHALVFVDIDPTVLPLGLSFSSLKYHLGSTHRFDWRAKDQLPNDAVKSIFGDIKRSVETYAGDQVSEAVIAVPSHFSTQRRSIVREVGLAAGFTRVDLINDTTAAALGHIYEQGEQARTILLYSMGFFGFEVSLLRYAHQRLRELGHEGGKAPSGRDFDMQIIASTIDAMNQQNLHLPVPSYITTNQWSMFRSRVSDLKERLSVNEEAVLELPAQLTSAGPVSIVFRRNLFEQMIARLIDTTISATQRALADADLRPDDVDEVLLVGGSTRIGSIQHQLRDLFGDKVVQPRDDLIARGAAIQAHRFAQQPVTSAPSERNEAEELISTPSTPTDAQLDALASEQTDGPPALPLEPDVEVLLAYARRLADLGHVALAADFLQKLERRSRILREQLLS